LATTWPISIPVDLLSANFRRDAQSLHDIAGAPTMSNRRHRFITNFLAILVIAGAAAANASIVTVIDPNCTGFTLGGVAPNQTLACVGAGGVVNNPMSITVADKYCDSFSLAGVAPNQILVCNSSVTAPTLVSAVSRKVHGAAGTFDLPLSLAPGNPSVEPRLGPTQTIVMTFDKPITAATPQVVEGIATTGTPTFSGNSVITPLVAVANQQYVTLSLSGVVAAGGSIAGNASVRTGFLAGDVNQNGVVTVADSGAVNAHLSQPVTMANFVLDINANGALTTADKGIVNGSLTTALPPP
jgi:hypothetical protein